MFVLVSRLDEKGGAVFTRYLNDDESSRGRVGPDLEALAKSVREVRPIARSDVRRNRGASGLFYGAKRIFRVGRNRVLADACTQLGDCIRCSSEKCIRGTGTASRRRRRPASEDPSESWVPDSALPGRAKAAPPSRPRPDIRIACWPSTMSRVR